MLGATRRGVTRRDVLGAGAFFAAASTTGPARGETPFRLGLTPVFLDNDALIIDQLSAALERLAGITVQLEQRRTYQ
jgi:phosphonate transport system substrate-binding protein